MSAEKTYGEVCRAQEDPREWITQLTLQTLFQTSRHGYEQPAQTFLTNPSLQSQGIWHAVVSGKRDTLL